MSMHDNNVTVDYKEHFRNKNHIPKLHWLHLQDIQNIVCSIGNHLMEVTHHTKKHIQYEKSHKFITQQNGSLAHNKASAVEAL